MAVHAAIAARAEGRITMKSGYLALMLALVAGPAFAQGTGRPAQPAPPQAEAAAPVQLSPPLVARVQRDLQGQGLYRGRIDGRFGPATRQGLEQFQSANNLRPTGSLDSATLAALGAKAPQTQQAAQPGQQPNSAQSRAQAMRAYQAREGAETRPGTGTTPGWAANASGSLGAAPGLPPQSLTQANGTLTTVPGAASGSLTGTGSTAPRGFFGYSSNMSNGFNAATGRER